MAAPDNILVEFKKITRYNIREYFQKFVDFLEVDQSKIISYYRGESKNINTKAFDNLKKLISETKKIIELIEYNQTQFVNYQWWLFVEQIEDNLNTLETIEQSPKWLRSVSNNINFSTNPEIEVILSQNETLEQLSRKRIGMDDWDNQWREIATRNDLKEEDYTPNGGNLLKVSFESTFSIEVLTVVDLLDGVNIYGKDIYKKLTFVDNDLKVLEPIQTFLQAVEILINLKKGNNPEFPEQGYNERLVVGSNVNFLNFPTLIRQLSSTFKTDDTISSMTVLDFKRDQDAVFIDYEVKGRLGDVEKFSISLP